MPLAVTKRGHQLLSFSPSDSPIPPLEEKHIPVPFALIVAAHQGKTLFVYNSWRQVWELPGGIIDEGETPEIAAKRELEEETSQIATDLEFVGLAKMQLKPDDRLEFGAIYTCELETIQPFQVNDEADRIMWWDMTSPVEEDVNAIDCKIAEMSHMYRLSAKDISLWNDKAQDYAETNGTDDDRIWQQFRDVMWSSLGDLNGVDVLDVGCGHGWLAGQMAEKGAQILGIDGSQTLLDIARKNYPDIQFIQHDLSAGLPLIDRKFDRIVANMVIMDIPDLTILMRDIRAVIKPSGRFIFTMPHPAFFFQKTGQDMETNQYFKKVTGYLKTQVWDVGHTHYHRSLSYYFDLLRENSFAVTRLYEPQHISLVKDNPTLASFYQDIPVFILIEAMPI